MRKGTNAGHADWSGIYAAVAEVALAKPLSELDRMVADAHATLPPDIRACLAASGGQREPPQTSRHRVLRPSAA